MAPLHAYAIVQHTVLPLTVVVFSWSTGALGSAGRGTGASVLANGAKEAKVPKTSIARWGWGREGMVRAVRKEEMTDGQVLRRGDRSHTLHPYLRLSQRAQVRCARQTSVSAAQLRQKEHTIRRGGGRVGMSGFIVWLR